MRPRSLRRLLASAILAAITGCPASDAGLGEACSDTSDCASALQCLAGACAIRCQRATDCGDGYACDAAGTCHLATGEQGDACASETECAPGLSCQINGADLDATHHLAASCVAAGTGHPVGATCAADGECRNGTCALGHCSDLCSETRDCTVGLSCMDIPRIDPAHAMANGEMFHGCLPSTGNLTWTIPIQSPSQTTLLPIPDAATAVSVMLTVDDPNQLVGVTKLLSPATDGARALLSTCPNAGCDPITELYTNPVRHRPELAQAVLAMPSSTATLLVPGAYQMTVSSLRQVALGGLVGGSAIPRVTAVVKLDSNVLLDLHFYFLDLTAHPCAEALGSPKFDAQVAKTSAGFQADFLGELRQIFSHGGVAIGSVSYEDVSDHPDLDGLEAADLPSLLALGHHADGINIFFVRTLSPVGIQALGPNPGPAIAGTRQSGIAIGVDSLCYRTWPLLARVTAHEIARFMGLYHNIETATGSGGNLLRDPIDDSDDSSSNLMFYSEGGGTDLSAGQRDVLTRSPVLR